jgi:hypothetical protein
MDAGARIFQTSAPKIYPMLLDRLYSFFIFKMGNINDTHLIGLLLGFNQLIY